MAIGGLLIVAGVVLHVRHRDSERGTSKIKMLGMEFELSAPSLVFLVLGVALLLSPFLIPSSSSPHGALATGDKGRKDPDPLPPPPPNDPAPRIDDFSVDASDINPGGSATLAWSSTNTSSCNLSPGIGPVATADSRSVSPGRTTTYTLRCNGKGRDASSKLEVRVSPVKTVDEKRQARRKLYCCDMFNVIRCEIVLNPPPLGGQCFCPGQGVGHACYNIAEQP